MGIAQITAILALLAAFGVPQPTIDTVQSILNNSIQPAQNVQQINTNSSIGAPSGASITTMPPQTTPVPQSIEIQANSPRANHEDFIVTFIPRLSDGSVDETATMTVTSDAPWWFPHGATVCKEGCNIGINRPFNANMPSDAGTYTMTATWGSITATQPITVAPEDK